jgi:hypothetical protein
MMPVGACCWKPTSSRLRIAACWISTVPVSILFGFLRRIGGKGVEVLSVMVMVQNFVTQTANLIEGVSNASQVGIVEAVVGALASEILAGGTLDLSETEQLLPIIEEAAAAAQEIDAGVDAQQLLDIAEQVATVMAEANQRIKNVVVATPNATIALEICRVQFVPLGETSQKIKTAAAGNKSIEDVLAENTGAVLDERIQSALGGENTAAGGEDSVATESATVPTEPAIPATVVTEPAIVFTEPNAAATEPATVPTEPAIVPTERIPMPAGKMSPPTRELSPFQAATAAMPVAAIAMPVAAIAMPAAVIAFSYQRLGKRYSQSPAIVSKQNLIQFQPIARTLNNHQQLRFFPTSFLALINEGLGSSIPQGFS